jgi:CubicO group peptidase (beta-lactamase class C family)
MYPQQEVMGFASLYPSYGNDLCANLSSSLPGPFVKAIRIFRLSRLTLAALFALLSHAAIAQQPELNADNIAGLLNPLMGEWTGKHRGPGAVVIVVTRDKQIFADGYGMADYAAKRPFTADATLVRPGSISKLFTAIAVMQLVDAGKLDLDRDVSGYIDFTIPLPDGGVPVTLRRLLSHRAGFEMHMKGLFSRAREPEPLGQWVKKGLPHRIFPNGDVEAYSNYGFALAGYIVERVSGEPFERYVQAHILDPLGMKHSTFRQPLPEDLAPLMAKSYRFGSDQPPISFETITAPAGALAATGEDIGRFMRALLNGGELDGVRILPKARLDEMMAEANPTPAGYIGLAFFGGKLLGHSKIGHEGITMAFHSHLELFPEHGIGIFVSSDGLGKITTAQDMRTIPNPVSAIARRFLPSTIRTVGPGESAADDSIASVYRPSLRADTTILRLNELVSQLSIRRDGAGDLKLIQAVLPFGNGMTFRRVSPRLYLGPNNSRLAFVRDAGGEPYLTQPSSILQRVPWWLDVRWIGPAVTASFLFVLTSVLAWPIAAVWRFRRNKPWSEDRGDRRLHLAVRLVLLVDVAVFIATAALFVLANADYTLLGDALDPFLIMLYAFAWAGVLGAALAAWAAISFWRSASGSRWARVHHSLLAASCLMLAWFFVVFRMAGTSLNY